MSAHDRPLRLPRPRSGCSLGACSAAARLLSRAFDEPLPEPARVALLRHLLGCAACRALAIVFARQRRLLTELARLGDA